MCVSLALHKKGAAQLDLTKLQEAASDSSKAVSYMHPVHLEVLLSHHPIINKRASLAAPLRLSEKEQFD